MSEVQFHSLRDGRSIAYRFTPGRGPTLVFLPGYMSDMAGGKATALFADAQERGQACLLLDYSGCGLSSGSFADGKLSRWRDEVLALIDGLVEGPVVVIGSSMGGWLMLLAAQALGDRLAGLVGIAAAPDFTEWGRSAADKAKFAAGETVYDENPYGTDPTPMHPGFFADGQALLQLGGTIPIDVPVRLIHGQRDADVPWDISIQLAQALRSGTVQVTLVKDGDHRLSREQDIALLLRIVADLSESLT
ncbi:alpha/beta fold hydrolase [Erythrobacter mangrovi]|uniref:Palmitoyl-protein thioesterase ABHD10, mitochondrial n=1 Tax=Erythrobacter mangrovi TaxID=2739433 RepID=A0A7D4C369_9SPHN|nr:alpha/beta hydrolase [Erythrobacter mangrovi]QKG70805.1 alpha/beta hydrolase [Erythrobacter mangrovi]